MDYVKLVEIGEKFGYTGRELETWVEKRVQEHREKVKQEEAEQERKQQAKMTTATDGSSLNIVSCSAVAIGHKAKITMCDTINFTYRFLCPKSVTHVQLGGLTTHVHLGKGHRLVSHAQQEDVEILTMDEDDDDEPEAEDNEDEVVTKAALEPSEGSRDLPAVNTRPTERESIRILDEYGRELDLGDWIWVDHSFHAIYAGDGDILLQDENTREIRRAKLKLSQPFSRLGFIHTFYSGMESVKRAEARVGEQFNADSGYFVYWCQTGMSWTQYSPLLFSNK